jgi:hypothetical protein
MTDLLVQYDADVNARDPRGVTVLANVIALGAADLIIVTSARSLERALPDRSRFLPKPYGPSELAKAIRELAA